MIVATAGHVDHGKTTLVRLLTGEDTDRLPEEKRRGMSIDLGFAYLSLAGREPIAFIDVPGHERFIRNMAAGVQGIDLALLVVAADDGPMPQTREHLQILELLGTPRLLVVLTKIDRVTPARVTEASNEVRTLLEPSRFKDADILPVSLTRSEGLDVVLGHLAAEASIVAPRRSGERFRMSVDRAFVMDGFGLVVTGTVLSGSIGAGDEVTIVPRGRRTRVRSLRANHGEAVRAGAGQRCALALHGLARGDVERGDTIADVGAAPRSKHVDVVVEPLPHALDAFSRRCPVSVHFGTAVLPAQVTPRGQGRLLARLSFWREVSAWQGDRLLLRDSGARRLLGAAVVVDPQPPERGAASRQRLALLERIVGLPAEAAFDALLECEPAFVNMDWIACSWHLSAAELERIESGRALAAFSVRNVRHVMSKSRWNALCDALEQEVAEWHTAKPNGIGARRNELKGPLAGYATEAFAAAIDALLEGRRLVYDGPYLRLPGHRPTLSTQDEALWHKTAPLLKGVNGRPPHVRELAEALRLRPQVVGDFLQRAAKAGRTYRIAPNRFFLPEAVGRLVDLAISLDEASAGFGFDAATFRDRSGLGRDLTIQALEFLDEAGYTLRSDERRRMRKPIVGKTLWREMSPTTSIVTIDRTGNQPSIADGA